MTTEADTKFNAKYPEHFKLKAVQDKSQFLGEFMEWANQNGMSLYKYEVDESLSENSSGKHNALVRVNKGINTLLSEFLGIDLNVLEEEKERMLNELRRLTNNNGKA